MDAILHKYDQVFPDVNAIIADVPKHKYYDAGAKTSDLVIQILGKVKAEKPLTFSPHDIIMFADGLVSFLARNNHFDHINGCLKDTEDTVPVLIDAINNFKNKQIVNGIVDIGWILTNFDNDLRDCGGMVQDWARIKNWVSVEFRDPNVIQGKVVDAMLHKYDQVFPDINAMIAGFSANQFHDVGDRMGDLLFTVLGQVGMSEEQVAATLI